ncbi:MAG: virulence factor Mce family protein [Conexibacter sp.]|nr:virulence factor Mce family protein [Conexibacter sp.]
MIRMRSSVVTILAAALVAGVFLTALLLSGGSAPSIGGRSYTTTLLAPTAVSVAPGNEVRIAGLQVGRVKTVRLQGRRAVIGMAINDDQAPLPRDTRFDIRLRTVIGETFIELHPGASKAQLPSGSVLPMSSQAHEYVEVEQILDVLKGRTRDRARRMIRGLGTGLHGHGPQLNRLLARTSGLVDGYAPLMAVLHRDRSQIARLVDQAGTVASSLADRGSAIRQLARQGRQTAQAVADRDDALRATIDRLPAALRQVRRTSGILHDVTGVTSSVVSDLARAVTGLRPSVDRLEPAARDGRAVIAELGASAPVLSRTLEHVEALSGPTAAALPQLKRTLCQLNPTVDYLAPYAKEAVAVIQNVASTTAYYDANGHAVRLHALVGDNNIAGMTSLQSQAMKLLLDSKLLGGAHALGYNPYPRPGDAGPPSQGFGQTGPRDYEGRYQRVEAAC